MLKKLLANPSAAIFGLLELGNPVIDRRIKLSESFLLLEDGIMTELSSTWRPEILANTSVKVASSSAERSICATEILGPFVELAELLNDS